MNESVLYLLQQEKTHLGKLLPIISGKKVTEYVDGLIVPQTTTSSEILSDRRVVAQALRSKLRGQLRDTELDQVTSQFLEVPILQTGDHCELLYDPQSFTNNFLYQMAMEKTPQQYLLTQQCSTPRMIQGRGPIRGPGFISLESGVYKVFDRSKGNLKDCNVATTGEVSFAFEPENPTNSAKLPGLLADLKGEHFDDAVSAFIFANRHIWDQLNIPNKRSLLLLDESLSSVILAQFLETPEHPLHKLFFDPSSLMVFRAVMDEYLSSPDCLILKDTTDLFWGKYNEELIPVKFNGDATALISDVPKKSLEIEYTPDSITESLRKGNLYPNLISSFLALSIFPQVTVIGGPSQYEYMFEIQEILRRSLKQTELASDSYIQSLTTPSLSTLAGIIGEQHPIYTAIAKLDRDIDFGVIKEALAAQKVEECLGDYEKFRYLEYYFIRRQQRRKVN